MQKLISIPGRDIYRLDNDTGIPAVYLIHDNEVGGILINSPAQSESLAAQMQDIANINFIFYPSKFGACDVEFWRKTLSAETLASEAEQTDIRATIDITIDRKTKLTRTIDFLTMAGRTRGTCALRLKNLPGAVFFGPILSPSKSGWPGLRKNNDDFSFESRLFGALALKDLKFGYAFTDDFKVGSTNYGPNASDHINREIQQALDL